MTLFDTTMQLCLILLLLVPLAFAGLALVNVGLGRSHSASHAMMGSVLAIAVATVVYVFLGSSLFGAQGAASRGLMLRGVPWSLTGTSGSIAGMLAEWTANGPPQAALAALAQVLCVSLAALVPLSAGADRWRLGAICISSTIFAGMVFPLFAHWAWADGWLAQLGENYGLGRGFIDLGAGVLQTTGGLSALVVTWLLGPRRAKYLLDGTVAAVPGHNIVLVFSGCLLLLPGWIALNAVNGILFAGVPLASVPMVAVNTIIIASGAATAAAALTRLRFGKADASLSANGWVAGLVAGSAACAWLTPAGALFTGLSTGVLAVFTVELLELKVGIDDPAGAISVHAVAGIWGLLSAPLLARGFAPGQVLAQLVGVATLLGCVLPALYLLNWCANRIYRYRADDDGERRGMDLHELGSGAYPEFVVHRDDFIQR